MLLSVPALLLALFGLAVAAPQSTYCSEDNLLRAFQHSPTPAAKYCSTATGYPTFVAVQTYPSTRLQSACSCYSRFPVEGSAAPTPTPTPTPPPTPVCPAPGVNLLINPGFDDGTLNGWSSYTVYSAPDTASVTSPGYNSAYTFEVVGQPYIYHELDQTVATVPGVTYTVTFEYQVATTAGKVYANVYSPGNSLYNNAITSFSGVQTGTWLSGNTVTFVPTDVSARLNFNMQTSGQYNDIKIDTVMVSC